jgi:hypothetical protein
MSVDFGVLSGAPSLALQCRARFGAIGGPQLWHCSGTFPSLGTEE